MHRQVTVGPETHLQERTHGNGHVRPSQRGGTPLTLMLSLALPSTSSQVSWLWATYLCTWEVRESGKSAKLTAGCSGVISEQIMPQSFTPRKQGSL